MGLDMYAYAVPAEIAPGETPTNEEWNKLFESKVYKEPERFFYWRKHPDLHGWMEQRYRARGGQEPEFNCTPLRLYKEDLDDLEKVVKGKKLPHTDGFFFGYSRADDALDDLKFIKEARAQLDEGFAVFYDSWW